MGLKMTHRKAVTSEAAKIGQPARSRRAGSSMSVRVDRAQSATMSSAALLGYHGGRAPRRCRIVVGQRRRSPRVYDEQVVAALKKVWYLNRSRQTAAVLRKLRRSLAIALDPDTRRKLQRISAATIDRLLRTERAAHTRRSPTKPTTRLMNEIPIRTCTEWQDARPGEVGADQRPRRHHRRRACLHPGAHRPPDPVGGANMAQKWVFQASSWLPACALHTQRQPSTPSAPLPARSASTSPVRAPTARTTTTSPQKNNDVAGTSATWPATARSRCSTSSTIGCLLVNFFYPSQKLSPRRARGYGGSTTIRRRRISGCWAAPRCPRTAKTDSGVRS